MLLKQITPHGSILKQVTPHGSRAWAHLVVGLGVGQSLLRGVVALLDLSIALELLRLGDADRPTAGQVLLMTARKGTVSAPRRQWEHKANAVSYQRVGPPLLHLLDRPGPVVVGVLDLLLGQQRDLLDLERLRTHKERHLTALAARAHITAPYAL